MTVNNVFMINLFSINKTRIITFMKEKLKKLHGQNNINKYRVTEHKRLQNIMSNIDLYLNLNIEMLSLEQF